MKNLMALSATMVAAWIHMATLVHGQIAVGCYQNQPDESSGKDSKTFQDIYMSQGACSNFCRANYAYAMMTEGSTCFCSNQKPQDSNKIDDAKCDKPCMGYPFEKCGSASSKSIATVLLVGSSPPTSSSTSSNSQAPNNSPSAGSDGTNKGTTGMGEESHGDSSDNDGGEGKELHSEVPGGTLPQPSGKDHSPVGGDEGEGGKGQMSGIPSPAPPQESSGSTPSGGSSGSSAGAIAASVMAILGLAGVFVVAIVFQKRRREKLQARESWSENMPLPSSLISTSNSNDSEGGHCHRHHSVRRHDDYTRIAPGYHHASSSMDGAVPQAPAAALPPPPVFHPRQNMHLHQPSYPPPPGHFNRHQYISHGLHEPIMTERPSNNPQAIIAGRVSGGYEYCSPGDSGDEYNYYPHPGSDLHSHNHHVDVLMRRGSHASGHGQRTRESMDSATEFHG